VTTVLTAENYRRLDIAQKARYRWLLQARHNQLTPGIHALCSQPVEQCNQAIAEAKGISDPLERREKMRAMGHYDWFIWLLLMGRGGGKTRSGAEDIAKFMIDNPKSRIALVAATSADGRKIMVEGESGLRSVIPASLIQNWNRSMGELVLTNGSMANIFTAEEPDRLRGNQFHRGWADELAAWQYLQDTWDQLMPTLRLGVHPRVLITTTPRGIDFIRDKVTRSRTPAGGIVMATGSTFDNSKNLPAPILAELLETYDGTRIGRQELYGEVLEDLEGALWSMSLIDDDRLAEYFLPEWRDVLGRTVVAVDPAVSSNEHSDETGIVVVAMTKGRCPFCDRADKPHAIVMEDSSGVYSPREWALQVNSAYQRWDADRVVAEVNQGGDLVTANLIAIAPNLPVRAVHATKGKLLRAEPVYALYEKHAVHHFGGADLKALEKQMVTFDPSVKSQKSPDRLDALVYALTELMLPKMGALPTLVRDKRHAGRR
jgi:phage terminase large subunit-like protein